MDVVLVKDVPHLGVEGAVVTVKPGFARHYLLPSGLAVSATPQAIQAIERATQQRHKRLQHLLEEAGELKRRLEAHPLTLTLALGDEDRAFGAITRHDVTEALARDGFTLDKHAVQLEHPIKALGTFQMLVSLHPTVTATVTVRVVKA